MRKFYAYIRVSTVKQGTQGVSLQEQKSAIIRYAEINNFNIVEWFEEQETAAKYGRPVFLNMLDKLRRNKAEGVVIHKIDRSARNLKDWATLGELLDSGIDVHFANESIDLRARGGRLSADIQAVIAADYIRNLREETRKGMYGRLKQGLYPFKAPIGYLDMGGGKVKGIDPAKAPLIKKAFEMYSTGEYSLKKLVSYLYKKGLRNRYERKLTLSGLSTLLNNPFYAGIIKLKSTGETFEGVHKPIVSKVTFDKVQDVLTGKTVKGTGKHQHIFRRLFQCKNCGFSLIGEKQKGLIYYRCHSKECNGTCVRQEVIEKELRSALGSLQLCEHEMHELNEVIRSMKLSVKIKQNEEKKQNTLALSKLKNRLDTLTDKYIDGDIEKNIFLRKKESLIHEIKLYEEKIGNIERNKESKAQTEIKNLELLTSLYLSYFQGNNEKKRRMVKLYTSNRYVDQKNVMIKLISPFQELSDGLKVVQCDHCRDRSRRMENLPTGTHCRNIIQKGKKSKQLNKVISEILSSSNEL